MKSFKLGQIVQTRTIYNKCKEDTNFYKEVVSAFNRYIKCDWGDLCDSDKELNEMSLNPNNEGRILAKYNTSYEPIYIITEWDRSTTTILFCDEY